MYTQYANLSDNNVKFIHWTLLAASYTFRTYY